MNIKRVAACLLLMLILWAMAAPEALSQGEDALPLEDYIRLHVVARSDSAWDQGVKLAVRDAVREKAAAILSGCGTAEEAWTLMQENLAAIEQAAQDTLSAWCPGCEAHAFAGVFPFPDRAYGDCVVPAGDYRAVRVVLGEGEGKNWWCVLFPSLCLPGYDGDNAPVVFYSRLGRWLSQLFGRDAA